MTIDHWLENARADADRLGLPDLKPLLDGLAQAARTLRAADWNDVAEAGRQASAGSHSGGAGRPSRGDAR